MHVELLDRNMVDSDIGVVNAARCSFDKESTWDYVCADESSTPVESYSKKPAHRMTLHVKPVIKIADARLIQYLAKHKHWTPFAHAQEVFSLNVTDSELLHFLLNANLSGFEWIDAVPWLVRGSLYAWCTNLQYLPADIARDIGCILKEKYLMSYNALKPQWNINCYSSDGIPRVHCIESEEPELQPFTLRIHCPIFVKRQLETHRRNFVMTDIEDFAQNEVSRRYVDKKVEIWQPDKWRRQSKDKKQGSSDQVLQHMDKILADSNYGHAIYMAVATYERNNSKGVAHELSRAVLPLGTYTTFWWTGSLKSWNRMFSLRLEEHAQAETRQIAQMCYDTVQQTSLPEKIET